MSSIYTLYLTIYSLLVYLYVLFLIPIFISTQYCITFYSTYCLLCIVSCLLMYTYSTYSFIHVYTYTTYSSIYCTSLYYYVSLHLFIHLLIYYSIITMAIHTNYTHSYTHYTCYYIPIYLYYHSIYSYYRLMYL